MEELNVLWFCILFWYFYSNKFYEIVIKFVLNVYRKKCYKLLFFGCVSYKFIYLFYFLIFFFKCMRKIMV